MGTQIRNTGSGLAIAKSAAEKIGLHGAAPTAQRAGAAQAALGAPTYAAPDAIVPATYAAPDTVPVDSLEAASPTTAEFNAALSALRSTRTQLIAAAADNAAMLSSLTSARTQLVALAADAAAHKTLINELRTALVEKGILKGAA